MKKTGFIVLLAMLAGRLWAVDGAWDIMDKAMGPLWNHDEGATTNQKWKAYIGNEVKGTTDTTSYAEGWVNITKLGVGSGAHSALINSEDMQLPTNTAYTIEIEARINRINKEQYPDESGVGFESNLLSARINQKTADFYLRYSDDPGETDKKKEGYAYLAPSLTPDEDELYYLDVSEWHKYRLIMSADNTVFDVYVDGKLVFESVPTKSMSSTSDIVRIGADPAYRCNVDVRHVRVGTGDFNSTSRISTISLSSDSHVVGAERTITVQANTVLMPEGQKLQVSLVDEQGKEVVAPAEYATSNNLATMEFTIPATVAEGKYAVQVSVPGGKVGEVEVEPKTFDYVVTGESPIGYFPKVNPVGFVRDIDDYQFIGAKKEFIFPSIVDAKAHLNADGKFLNGGDTIARYYLFYTPHENPGGMFLSTAPTLDGPWTEYAGKSSSSTENGRVMTFEWAITQNERIGQGGSHEKHISACQVVWNEDIRKYVMYFHGPNPISHYATSDNLLDWEYGGVIFESTQFAAGAAEASYAKAFEYTVPGLDNKYVMLLMTQQGNIRRIYWAHSKDGLSWTPVRKALVSPDLDYKKVPGTDVKPDYSGSFGNNVAGPSLWVEDGRCMVLCHGSSGNMFVVEVGAAFDREIHWGEYMRASDVLIDTDDNGNKQAVPRISSAQFIQSDTGEWYMFFEAGSRLGANIAYAKESAPLTGISEVVSQASTVSLSRNVLDAAEALTVSSLDGAQLSEAVFYNLTGREISRVRVDGEVGILRAPVVPGMYILRVLQDDQTTQEFKVVVR